MNISVNNMYEVEEALSKIRLDGMALTPATQIHLHIYGVSKPIRLCLAHPVALGRASKERLLSTDVDLTGYGAIDKGVSRQHAIMELGEQSVILYDLGSTNGTYVNGERLRPYHRHSVCDGDEVRLGSLVMHIFY